MNAERSAVAERLEDAMVKHRAGQLAAAAAGYERVLALEPTNFDALHFLGVIALQSGNAQQAIDLLLRALDVQANAHPAVQQLGVAYIAVGRNTDAATQFARAAALAPDYAPTHESLARLLYDEGRLEEAANEFGIVTRLLPNSATGHTNLGTALGQLGRYGDALACYEKALAIEPQHLDALLNSAQALVKLGRLVEAIDRFRTLLAQQPASPNVCYQAGFLFYSQGLRTEAQAAFAQALNLDPQHLEARWASAIAELPLAYGPSEVPAQFRQRFAQSIAYLDDWFDEQRTPLGHRVVGNQQPFYLAFHELSNVALLTRYGDLCARLMQAWRPGKPFHSRRSPSNAPIRLAIASGFFYDQSVWTALIRGWCAHLDRRRVEIHLLNTGDVADAQTAVARSQATGMRSGPADLAQWVDAIERLEPDVLLYPEIGMDTMCAKLASLRLAPVQVASWGHPETTGLPTIDYFLSAESFEPPGGEANYREQLITLPNLGCYYDPLAPPEDRPRWDTMGIEADIPRLICAGTPYKYFPEHDHVFVDIARSLGRCLFLFFIDMAPRLSRQIEERLALAFAGGGLAASDHVRFLPRQTRQAFFGMMRDCDVYLDTIGFSGFNSAMQAVECGLPIVTLEGQFMRGRFAAGVLKRIGMEELVVHDSAAYVDTAVRLCKEPRYRRDTVQRIATQKNVLFRDLAPVRALEAVLRSIATTR
jgi:protein O-GlcNAc transferase